MTSIVKTFNREVVQSFLLNIVRDKNWVRPICSSVSLLKEITTPSSNDSENVIAATTNEKPVEVNNKFREDNRYKAIPPKARFVYPEFLPDPTPEWRNLIREKLERMDMMRRRTQLDIPEFYVGSVLAVTSSTIHNLSKTNRFVGICIQRTGCGLRAQFVLRNVIDHLGAEIVFRMYDPLVQQIQVLKLEKRLDNELFYLRDALPEYSTFPMDMEPELLPEGAQVPINEIKVKLKPKPWTQRWDKKQFIGIAELPPLSEKNLRKVAKTVKPWEKYDLMKQYRSTIPEEEQNEIYSEVISELHQLELLRKKIKRKRMFIKPTKSS